MTFDSIVWDKMPKQKKSQLNETATYFFSFALSVCKIKEIKLNEDCNFRK